MKRLLGVDDDVAGALRARCLARVEQAPLTPPG